MLNQLSHAGTPNLAPQFFFNVYLFFRERETEHEWGKGGGAEREREREGGTESKPASGSEPSAQSSTQGSNSEMARYDLS